MNDKRLRLIKSGIKKYGPVAYLMSRDQRVKDNWALLYAQQLAIKNEELLIVLFNLVPNFLDASIRQYGFMLKGLREVEKDLSVYNIKFIMLCGNPEIEVPKFINENNISQLITDFDPLKIKQRWKSIISEKISIPIYEVDAHNIVPCLYISQKIEFGAYTIRPKINKALPEFLEEYPRLSKMKKNHMQEKQNDWDGIYKKLEIDFSISEIDWIKPGEKAASEMMLEFFENKITLYNEVRNDPTKNVLSNLSPYLHFGQISAQRIVLDIERFNIPIVTKESFLEELIVRRELSDNFCYYNKNYDSFEGFPEWAKATLNAHRDDKREFIYSSEEFELAKTHDDLWNAAQIEMVRTGKMHGYMRMYWAKKILEWSTSPEEALRISIYLNNKYELDGRDPNGYVGCTWAIGGVHDRAWKERPIYGKIRYMNRNGCERKFDVETYIVNQQKK